MLAPGAREKVFIQKFYLYLNLTKPSDGLYVTYSRVSPEGKALRRSYLIGTLCNMFRDFNAGERDRLSAGGTLDRTKVTYLGGACKVVSLG